MMASALALGGCGSNPIAALELPGQAGKGPGSYDVVVEMADVTNLVPRAEVKLRDVTVGSVRDISVEDWRANVRIGLDAGVVVPRNAVARIAQKSLLGAEYLELVPPPQPGVADGELRDGDVIPVSRTGRYPETEEVLAALSVVLNGGGLSQVQTITQELNAAFSGHEQDVQNLIKNLTTFVGTLNNQRSDIVRTIDGLDKLSAGLNANRNTLGASLEAIPAGLRVVNDQRAELVRALTAVGDLGDVAHRVIASSGQDIAANLHALPPILDRLADSGHNISGSLLLLPTYPWPDTAFPAMMKGDWGNLFLTLDVGPQTIARNYGGGIAIPKMLDELPPLGVGGGQKDPLLAPFEKDPSPQVSGVIPTNPGHSSNQGNEPNGTPEGPAGGTAADLFGSLRGGNR
jgi:phospholipid/cholesterol/gamma-HCH transport system substrate-binding protein